MSTPALKGVLDRCADFVKVKKGELGEDVLVPARPPDDVVKDILSQQGLPFPALKGFASTPIFLSGGRLLTCDGYDPESGIYVSLDGLEDLKWDMPLKEAKDLLLSKLLVDFPFADEASKAHAIATLLLPFLRQMITGPTPLHLFDAPARGTGKGLLADLVAIVTTGSPAYVMALPRDDDEVDKRITSTLLAGHQLVLLDNVTVLRSTALSAALTTTLWRGRVLGKSQMANVPNTATWIGTGNNVELSDEVNRRTVFVRLDAKMESPEERTEFKYPLPAWAIRHRSELVSACMSIINRWVQEGMPLGEATLGRFEDWARVMGGVLGVSDFLQNREQQKGRDSESGEWASLCEAWWGWYEGLAITAKDVLAIAKDEGLLLDYWAGRKDIAAQQRIGHALSRRMDRIFGKYQICSGGDGSTGNKSYRLKITPAGGGNKTPKTPETPPDRYENGGSTGRCFGNEDAKTPPKTPPETGCFEPPADQNTPQDSDTNSGVLGDSGVFNRPQPDTNSGDDEDVLLI